MRADKRLGQHFLRDIDVLQDIAAIADAAHSAGVLEIGPGEGAMTAFLVQGGKPVVALDKDPRAVEEVGRRFGSAVRALEGDALTADLGALLPAPSEDGRLPIVVGNLPYNVGSAIYRRLLTLRGRVSRLVLMLQREVAQRIVAEPGTRIYGVPSVITALTASAHIVLDVPPEAFVPRPKVHSSVVLVEFPGEPVVPPEELEALGRFVGRIFQARRKMLSNSVPLEVLAEVGLEPSLRPEQASPNQFVALWRASGSPK